MGGSNKQQQQQQQEDSERGRPWRRAPRGHFVVYVGEDLKRYELPISSLKNPKLQQLLQKAADEFGFDSQKGIVLPCDESALQTTITDFITKCT